MITYLLRRLVYAVPIALAVGFVCFMLVQIAPGDPINAIVPADAPGVMIVARNDEDKASLHSEIANLRVLDARGLRGVGVPLLVRAGAFVRF